MENVDFFKKQVQLEYDIVTAARAAVKDIKNLIVKELAVARKTSETKTEKDLEKVFGN